MKEGTCPSHRLTQTGHIMWMDLVAGDEDFVHLAQVVSVGFLYHKATIFLSIVSKYIAGNYFEKISMSCSHNSFSHYFLHPLNIPPYRQLLIVVAWWWFSFSFFLYFLMGLLSKIYTFSPVYLLSQLCIYISMVSFYSIGCILRLALITLLLQLVQLWPLAALSDWFLCPFNQPYGVFFFKELPCFLAP